MGKKKEKPKTAEIDQQDKQNILDNIGKNVNKKQLSNNKKDSKLSEMDVRNEFSSNLAKIYENATRKEGVNKCHSIIQKNSGSPSMLRIFIGVLCDKSI